MKNLTFYIGLFLSFIFHLCLLKLPFLPEQKPFIIKKVKPLEVIYPQVNSFSKKEKSQNIKHNVKVLKQHKPLKKVEVFSTAKKGRFVPRLESHKTPAKLKGQFRLEKKKVPKIKLVDKSSNGYVPSLETEKITNTKHLDYYDGIKKIIRLRIKNQLSNRLSGIESTDNINGGDVYLSFILNDQGVLKHIRIREDKTLADDELKQMILETFSNVHALPPFPNDFDYSEFSFKLMISVRDWDL